MPADLPSGLRAAQVVGVLRAGNAEAALEVTFTTPGLAHVPPRHGELPEGLCSVRAP